MLLAKPDAAPAELAAKPATSTQQLIDYGTKVEALIGGPAPVLVLTRRRGR